MENTHVLLMTFTFFKEISLIKSCIFLKYPSPQNVMAHDGMALICTQIMHWPGYHFIMHDMKLRNAERGWTLDNISTKFHQMS
jgi:hypothetical protein